MFLISTVILPRKLLMVSQRLKIQTNRTVIRSNPSMPPESSSPTLTGPTPAGVPV